MNSLKKILLFLFFISASISFYEGNTPIVILNSSNFDKLVTNSPDIWLIEFYAPWCGHCKEFHPEFEKIARATKGLFKLGAVNCEEERDLAQRYKVEGFPTVLFFGDNKDKFEEYEGDREAKKIIDYLYEKAKKITNKKLKELKHFKTDL